MATGDTMLGVPVGGYAASSTTYNYQICANTGCYIINWYDSWEMVGLTSTELKDIY